MGLRKGKRTTRVTSELVYLIRWEYIISLLIVPGGATPNWTIGFRPPTEADELAAGDDS